ncbi:MAG: hypothetical protein HY774_25320 [Acidobacteria bacterium]|nr:hypothetical protein [Acidobacteriota bacterium]
MSLFDTRLSRVNTEIWKTTGPLVLPERQIPEVSGRKNVGVTFSGGGTRSASATLGQLRALNALGLISGIRYLSCVSGGSWASIPFLYLPENYSDELFLGPVIEPQNITLSNLVSAPPGSLSHTIANSEIVRSFLDALFNLGGFEAFSRALGKIFLDPFGIGSVEKFFTYSATTRSGIRQTNPKMRDEDFYLQKSNRPFWIVGGTLFEESEKDSNYHFEFTPLYAGISTLHQGQGINGLNIGGGYVEPFAFDSESPGDQGGPGMTFTCKLGGKAHWLTLSDVIGTSGAAPARVLNEMGLDWIGFPEFRYWPPADMPRANLEKSYPFGDGGFLENLGLIALLKRKVERIVCFVNTRDRLEKRSNGSLSINTSLPPLFARAGDFTLNHVFPEVGFQKLVDGLLAAQSAGGPVMFQDRYQVLENAFYGVPGGWEVDVLWVYNNRVPTWEARLTSQVRELLKTSKFERFPHYKTFGENLPHIIDLTPEQVELLAHLSCWNVLSHEAVFDAFLNGAT